MVMADLVQYYGTGRRKASVARIFLRPGSGNFVVNQKPFETYFVTHQQRVSAKRPLELVELGGTFDVLATVKGGGVSAQADAVKMGIARALLEFNLELRKTLKADGLLSRDARIKERKKYGQKGARKRFQFSKRKKPAGDGHRCRTCNAVSRCHFVKNLPRPSFLERAREINSGHA